MSGSRLTVISFPASSVGLPFIWRTDYCLVSWRDTHEKLSHDCADHGRGRFVGWHWAAQQYGEMIATALNYRGELTCPSNYDTQNGWCVSIYSPRSRYAGPGYGGPRYDEPEPGYGGPEPGYGSPGPGYGGPRAAGPVTRPWVNQYGQLQCPSNYVLDPANNCVSIDARRRYY